MFFTINELSIQRMSSKTDGITMMMDFADLCKGLFAAGFTTARIWNKNEFMSFEISENFRLYDWVKSKNITSNKERLSMQSLKSILTKQSILNFTPEERREIEDCPLVAIQLEDEQVITCPGIKIACLTPTLAVSFPSQKRWSSPNLKVIYLSENLEEAVNVHHASQPTHLALHHTYIRSLVASGRLLKNWQPSVEPFPNLEYSNECVQDGDWSNFQKERTACSSDGERLSIIIKYGKLVAIRNRYEYDARVSALNSTNEKKRIIFSAGFGKNRRFLSIDLEKGGFEFCNYDGSHLGEYFFDGTLTGNPKANHGIAVKS